MLEHTYYSQNASIIGQCLVHVVAVQTGLHPPAQLELLLHSKQISTLSPSSLNSINSLLESSFELLTPSPLPLYYCIICIHHIVHPPITFTHICILFYAHPAYICSPLFHFCLRFLIASTLPKCSLLLLSGISSSLFSLHVQVLLL